MNAVSHTEPIVRLSRVGLSFGRTRALDQISLDIPSGLMVGLIGPDGAGKSTLLSLIAGARIIQDGLVEVLGGDIGQKAHRDRVGPLIAYMPQGLGKNLYPMLSIEENLQFFARLFGHNAAERRRRIDYLTKSTGLYPFLNRPAGKLSGGMKQKLGLCSALIHDPDLLILDEPTTGVDPLARVQFWDLINRVRQDRPDTSVIVATAYMDEAARFDWLAAIDDGQVLDAGKPKELLSKTGSQSLEEAFIKLLPEKKREGYEPVDIKSLYLSGQTEVAIEAENLTKRFGDFTAVDHVNFRIQRGEIFGFLGSNGCGKSTTMKMLTGLLPVTEGRAWLFGHEVDPDDLNTRLNVGYMSQTFSLYSELTVEQNLTLHARLFNVPQNEIPGRVGEMVKKFDLEKCRQALPDDLPMGVRQRLSLAVAMVHKPSLLILDEPTSGVDPVARNNFWRYMIDLSREDGVTIFISTHFMNEAERCDRISLMHAGRVLAAGPPRKLVEDSGQQDLENAFIQYLKKVDDGMKPKSDGSYPDSQISVNRQAQQVSFSATAAMTFQHDGRGGAEPPSRFQAALQKICRLFSMKRMLSYAWRETLELRRDPVRTALALLGSVILMVVIGMGISMDVEDLSYAVLDRDQTELSRSYTLNISGSRYFTETPPIKDYEEMDRRLRGGNISLAIEIPPGFGRKIQRGDPAEVGAWVDGAMPMRAETINGYVKGLHQQWLTDEAARLFGQNYGSFTDIQIRYRYNPNLRSMLAMMPGVIPILLLMLPAMLAALSVVREKEIGSITNLYVTPVTKSEFIVGKQIPYVALGMLNFFLMVILSVTVFDIPVKGSFAALTFGAFLYCLIATSIGLLASAFTRSQVAAMFVTMVGTMMPAIQFSGLINSTSSLEGLGRLVGQIYPTTHMLIISRGIFSKALGFSELTGSFCVLLIMFPVIMAVTITLLKKQEG